APVAAMVATPASRTASRDGLLLTRMPLTWIPPRRCARVGGHAIRLAPRVINCHGGYRMWWGSPRSPNRLVRRFPSDDRGVRANARADRRPREQETDLSSRTAESSGHADADEPAEESVTNGPDDPAGEPDTRSDRTIVLGLIADPDMPEAIADHLAETLPDELGEGWRIEVDADPVTASLKGTSEILEQTAHLCDSHGWTYAICITDLPVRSEDGPVVADVDHDRGVAVMSVPGIGGFQTRRRIHRVVRQVLDDLHEDYGERHEPGESH